MAPPGDRQALAHSRICSVDERGLYRGKPFQDWIEALHSRDVRIRREAAQTLSHYDPHAHSLVPALFDTLRDTDPEVRRLGAQALGRLGDQTDLAPLLQRTRDKDPAVRAAALSALGVLVSSSGDDCHPRRRISPVPEAVLSTLLEALGNDELAIRLAAIESLNWLGPDAAAAAPVLRDALRDPGTSEPAFLALDHVVGDRLWESGSQDLLPVVLRIIQRGDRLARSRAVASLGLLGKLCRQPSPSRGCDDGSLKMVRGALEGALADHDRIVRYQAAEALAEFGADARGSLDSLIGDLKRGEIREVPSASTLDRIGPEARPDVVAALLESLKDSRLAHGDCVPTLRALRTLSPEAAQSGLHIVADFLDHDDLAVRRMAAWTLGEMGAQAQFAIPALLERLRDGDQSVRFQAISSLKKVGPGPDTVPSLVKAFRAGDARFQMEVADVLGQMGHGALGAAPTLIRALNGPEDGVRRAAGSALRLIGPDFSTLAPVLRKRLRSTNSETRLSGITAIQTIGPSVARGMLPEIIEALEDPDVRVRRTAVWSTSEMVRDTKELVPALARRLEDEDVTVRVSSADAIGQGCRSNAAAIPALIEAMKDPDRQVRWVAINAMENCGATAAPAVPALVEALRDGDKENRQAVVRVLGRIGPEARLATRPLIDLLGDNDDEGRPGVQMALWAIKPDPEVAVPAYSEWLQNRARLKRWIPATALGYFDSMSEDISVTLAFALHDSDPRVRTAAVGSLARLSAKSADAFDVLAGALEDPDPAVREESVQAFVEMGPRASGAIPDLVRILADSKASTRRQAATALGSIGPEASAAIPALRKAAQDSDPEVSAEAARVLGLLTAKPTSNK